MPIFRLYSTTRLLSKDLAERSGRFALTTPRCTTFCVLIGQVTSQACRHFTHYSLSLLVPTRPTTILIRFHPLCCRTVCSSFNFPTISMASWRASCCRLEECSSMILKALLPTIILMASTEFHNRKSTAESPRSAFIEMQTPRKTRLSSTAESWTRWILREQLCSVERSITSTVTRQVQALAVLHHSITPPGTMGRSIKQKRSRLRIARLQLVPRCFDAQSVF